MVGDVVRDNFWGAQAASLFFSAACRKALGKFVGKVSLRAVWAVVGKLPTTTGWEPVLPREGFAAPRGSRSTLVRPLASRIQLARALEMFFGQLSHTKVLEAAPNHPMEKGIIGRELIGLPFITTGFFGFT